MIKFIKGFFKREEPELLPYDALNEQYTLLVKMARRCAYDLAHCASDVKTFPELREMFSERAVMWQGIFSPDGVKDYRHRLHLDLERLENACIAMDQLLQENNIDNPYWSPF